MAHCTGHEQCPACANLGKDRDGNNLAVYSDSSMYCFSCGFYRSANGLQQLKAKDVEDARAIRLPNDVDEQLPQKAWDYLGNYSLTEHDVKINTILWSEYWQRLIFPYFNAEGLLAWQGRYLGEDKDKAKWFSQGPLHEFIHVVGHNKNPTVVLTEDVISAICVAKVSGVCASPLFGSHISVERLLRLQRFYDTIVVYLDKDKQTDAIKFSHQARLLGVKSYCVITDKDPKEYSTEELHKCLYKS